MAAARATSPVSGLHNEAAAMIAASTASVVCFIIVTPSTRALSPKLVNHLDEYKIIAQICILRKYMRKEYAEVVLKTLVLAFPSAKRPLDFYAVDVTIPAPCYAYYNQVGRYV